MSNNFEINEADMTSSENQVDLKDDQNKSFIDKLANKIPMQFRIPILALASSCGLISLIMNSGFNSPSEIERIVLKINSNPNNIPALVRDFNLDVPEEYLALIESSGTTFLELYLDADGDEFLDGEISIISDGEAYPVINLERYHDASNITDLNSASFANISGVSIEVERTVYQNSNCTLSHNLQIAGNLVSEIGMDYYENRNQYTLLNSEGTELISINNLNVPDEPATIIQGTDTFDEFSQLPPQISQIIEECVNAYTIDLEG